MAKRMKSKIQPAVMKLNFNISSQNGTFSEFIDLSQVTSLVNRRFYRQGLLWAVSGLKVQQKSSSFIGPTLLDPTIVISKLPHTWVMSNAWEKGFRAWMRMNKEALAESPSARPKFLDFKIFADSSHHSNGISNNLLPVDASGNVALPGEWAASQFHIPSEALAPGSGAVRDREIIAIGASYPGAGASGFDAVSLIEGYVASRALPNILDPNTPADMSDTDGIAPENWISAVFNEGTEQVGDVLNDMQTDNDIAPYPFENDGTYVDTMYPGGANQLSGLEIHDRAVVTGTTIGGTSYFSGGSFPCGLVKVTFSNFNADPENPVEFNLELTLVPGSNRGYLAESMTEM